MKPTNMESRWDQLSDNISFAEKCYRMPKLWPKEKNPSFRAQRGSQGPCKGFSTDDVNKILWEYSLYFQQKNSCRKIVGKKNPLPRKFPPCLQKKLLLEKNCQKVGWSPEKGHSGGGHGGVEKSIPVKKTSAVEKGIPETAMVPPSVGSVAGWPEGDVGWGGSLWQPSVTYCRPNGCSSYGL